MLLERERPPTRSYLARQIRHGSIVFDSVRFKYPNATMPALDERFIFDRTRRTCRHHWADRVGQDDCRPPADRTLRTRTKAAFWSKEWTCANTIRRICGAE